MFKVISDFFTNSRDIKINMFAEMAISDGSASAEVIGKVDYIKRSNSESAIHIRNHFRHKIMDSISKYLFDNKVIEIVETNIDNVWPEQIRFTSEIYVMTRQELDSSLKILARLKQIECIDYKNPYYMEKNYLINQLENILTNEPEI